MCLVLIRKYGIIIHSMVRFDEYSLKGNVYFNNNLKYHCIHKLWADLKRNFKEKQTILVIIIEFSCLS